MITLRPIEKEDLEMLRKWRNSPEVFPYVREYRLITRPEQEKWYENYLHQSRTSDWDTELFVLELETAAENQTWTCTTTTGQDSYFLNQDKQNVTGLVKKPIGVGGFTRVEWKNRKAEFSFYIGESEHRNTETIKEALKLLLKKGFNEWNFNKVYWPVYEHDPNFYIYNQVFNLESVLKSEYYWSGKFQDRLYLSLLKKDFKF